MPNNLISRYFAQSFAAIRQYRLSRSRIFSSAWSSSFQVSLSQNWEPGCWACESARFTSRLTTTCLMMLSLKSVSCTLHHIALSICWETQMTTIWLLLVGNPVVWGKLTFELAWIRDLAGANIHRKLHRKISFQQEIAASGFHNKF